MQMIVAAFKAIERVFAVAFILFNKKVFDIGRVSLFKDTIKVHIAFAYNRHSFSECKIFQVDTRDPSLKALYPFGGVGTARLYPEGVKSESHFVGGHFFSQLFDDEFPILFIEFKIVVMVHKVLAVFVKDMCGLLKVIDEIVGRLLVFIIESEPTESDIFTIQYIVVTGNFYRISLQLFTRCMGEDTSESVLIKLGFKPRGVIIAGSRDLNRPITDVGNLFK